MAGVPLPMRRFYPIDRETDLLLPLSVQDWLSKGHLARDLVEVVEAGVCRYRKQGLVQRRPSPCKGFGD